MGLHHHHTHDHDHEHAEATSPAFVQANLRVARLSVITALSLAILKLAAVVITGSLSIAAALADSVMDVIASSVNYFAVRLSGQPADEEHRYGHGKAEGIAGLAQGLIIAFLGLYLLVEGIHRVSSSHGELEHTEVGIGVMLISLVASAWIGWLLLRTGKRTGSVALQADAAHYTSDIWMNLGVLASLLAVRFSGLHWIDGAVSCVVALVVLRTALIVLRRSAGELMDTSLSEAQIKAIREAIARDVPETRDIHALRTRKSGPDVFVDMHVSFDRSLNFPDAHRLSEQVRVAVETVIACSQVHVHADPYPFLPEDNP
jgi:ferrous-iron efflux pump FieF